MKKFVAMSILLGYLLLVPACFLAENFLNTNMTMAGMSDDHCMMGMPCSTESSNTPISPLGSVSNHLSMYVSMTGFVHEIVSLLYLSVFFFFITLLKKYTNLSKDFELLNTRFLNYQRRIRPHIPFLRDFFHWLKLKVASPPPYALAY